MTEPPESHFSSSAKWANTSRVLLSRRENGREKCCVRDDTCDTPAGTDIIPSFLLLPWRPPPRHHVVMAARASVMGQEHIPREGDTQEEDPGLTHHCISGMPEQGGSEKGKQEGWVGGLCLRCQHW